MSQQKDVLIPGEFKTAKGLAMAIAGLPMVIDARATGRHYHLAPGNYLRRETNGAGQPSVQAFLDYGDHHEMIEVEMPTDEEAFNELVQEMSGEEQDSGDADEGEVNSPPPPSPPPDQAAKKNAPASTRRTVMPRGPGSSKAPLPKKSLGRLAAEIYARLADHFKIRGQRKASAVTAKQLVKDWAGTSASYVLQTLFERKLLVNEKGQLFLIEAEITIDRRGGGSHHDSSVSDSRPSRAVASSNGRASRNGHGLLEILTEHQALVRSIGLLSRRERIGPTITMLEKQLSRLDQSLCVVDGRDGFALKLRAAQPLRHGRPAKAKRR